MNQSGLAHRRKHLRLGTLAAATIAFVGLSACQPVPLPGEGDGGAPTSALTGTTWTAASNPDQPTAGAAFEVGSTVRPTQGIVEDLVLVQTFPAGVAVEGASGSLEAWDPATDELIHRDAVCAVSGQITACAIEGTVDSDWVIDRLEIRAAVTVASAGGVDVTLDASAADPTGADPVPVHQVTTVTVAA